MKRDPREESLRKSNEAIVNMAKASGICPKCQSPMIPTSSRKTSICSNGKCDLGVIPKCRTHRPANVLFQSLRKQKKLGAYPVAEKVKGLKRFRVNGSTYSKLKSIGLIAAKKATGLKQKTMLETEVAPKKKEPFLLSDKQVIASFGKGLYVFELI